MNILYICTHNRCRSILSEAITNHLGQGKLQAFSAGSHPVGQVHPLTLKYLAEKGVSTKGLRSQSWHEFASEPMDIVVTVCDSAASETCPVWFGDRVKVHWSLPDPSKLEGSQEAVQEAFFSVMKTIEQRIYKVLNLDFARLSKVERHEALKSLV